ncbi:MarR family winged helix-turn-helix transcriptional regulator [Arthrobacter roseus]|uniref:MarR family winged helix-turn-helix transcriptional regulator n=1 Tax=Arthrobacter roseus TaxID=136274 RepID=UPI001966A171|nr:MarR family transcriptional regulator [Arthrobacter roseus]MBM7848237.1 DNA-binding MarR family transcriptional regulator [Arthrobacter roseus]
MTEQGVNVAEGAADAAIKALEEQLSILWRRARSNSHKVARRVHPDMEPAAYGLLVILQRTGGMRLTDLATNVGIGKPSVSRQITMLEQLGLVQKTADPQDGRAQAISLTPLGSSRLFAAQSGRKDAFRHLMEDWSAADIGDLARLLGQLNETYTRDNY